MHFHTLSSVVAWCEDKSRNQNGAFGPQTSSLVRTFSCFSNNKITCKALEMPGKGKLIVYAIVLRTIVRSIDMAQLIAPVDLPVGMESEGKPG